MADKLTTREKVVHIFSDIRTVFLGILIIIGFLGTAFNSVFTFGELKKDVAILQSDTTYMKKDTTDVQKAIVKLTTMQEFMFGEIQANRKTTDTLIQHLLDR